MNPPQSVLQVPDLRAQAVSWGRDFSSGIRCLTDGGATASFFYGLLKKEK
ncbi:MAG: hypothetical protein K2L60_05085 [Bacteroides sp.]|nr:hypothetical protein [Bacteroides sp.]